jgi:hypothetical protein
MPTEYPQKYPLYRRYPGKRDDLKTPEDSLPKLTEPNRQLSP